MSDYTIAERDDAFDFMAEYPGYGEMRSYTDALGAEQVAFTWRRMPAGTGGRGGYGHRHKSQEQIYFVIPARSRSRSTTTSSRLPPGRRSGSHPTPCAPCTTTAPVTQSWSCAPCGS